MSLLFELHNLLLNFLFFSTQLDEKDEEDEAQKIGNSAEYFVRSLEVTETEIASNVGAVKELPSSLQKHDENCSASYSPSSVFESKSDINRSIESNAGDRDLKNILRGMEEGNVGPDNYDVETYCDSQSDVETDSDFEENNLVFLLRCTKFRQKCTEGQCTHKPLPVSPDLVLQISPVCEDLDKDKCDTNQIIIATPTAQLSHLCLEDCEVIDVQDTEEDVAVVAETTRSTPFLTGRNPDGDFFAVDLEEWSESE